MTLPKASEFHTLQMGFSEWIRMTYKVADPPNTGDALVHCQTERGEVTWEEGGFPPKWMYEKYLKEMYVMMSEPLTDAELAAFDAFAPALVLGDKNRALRAENERLRVCGTCGRYLNGFCTWCAVPSTQRPVPLHMKCRCTPSRWIPYWEED